MELKGIYIFNGKKFWHFAFRVSFLLMFIIACNGGGGRRTAGSRDLDEENNNIPTPTPTPFSGTALNFLQVGSTTTEGRLDVASDFANQILLLGNEVNDYLITGDNLDNTNNLCMVVTFPTSTENNHLILAAIPKKILAGQGGSAPALNVFFQMSSNNAGIATNKALCQKAALQTTLSTASPGATFAYGLKDVCSTCGVMFSGTVRLFSPGGTEITQIRLNNLSIGLGPAVPDQPVGFCTEESQCSALGLDCCLQGQCVNDKTVKSSVDQTSVGFQLAQLDISKNPAHIFNYPNFFNLCTLDPGGTPTPTATPDASATAAANQETLRDLFDCTTRSDEKSELSICTALFEDATATITTGGGVFTTLEDDRNFHSIYSGTSTLPLTSIREITYAGQGLFLEGTSTLTLDPSVSLGTGNDDLTNSTSITMITSLPANAPHEDMKLRYAIDGSCIEVNVFLVQCTKFYTQGQNLGGVADHTSGNQSFLLPEYADGTKSIVVKVDDSIRFAGTHYNINTVGTQLSIDFNVASQVFDGQDVTIEYFVDRTTFPNVFQAKATAQETINSICNCGVGNCSLEQVLETINGVSTVVDYKCVYPEDTVVDPPLNETVVVDVMTVPVRFFDTNGVNFDTKSIAGATQEGKPFSYTNGDTLLPANASTPIGFNEIYGTLSTNVSDPRPPVVLRTKVGRNYDIFVNSGIFSSCIFCGTDYYDFVNQIFPSNLTFKGGGYLPDPTKTNRKGRSSTPINIRSDDLLFGRACFVPATMIPWTHNNNSDLQTQRLNRLAAQHFLFSNGYQRDWYGFDYGSVIGSFDGVHWFSIGNSRRIKATSTKLFLAVNAYYGDLTIDNGGFSVTVTDSSTVPGSGPRVTRDIDSDGALCQQYHFCSSDAECVSNLGWDYSCQSIVGLTTTYPSFDDNAQEQPGLAGAEETKRLVDLIVGGANGQSRRCVYRGAGSPCHGAYTTTVGANSYHKTNNITFNACSMNNYCKDFATAGVDNANFNDRINRFANPPQVQNASGGVTPGLQEDHFGLAAHILGRPLLWNGTNTVSTTVQGLLATNNVSAVCIHGRDPDQFIGANTYLDSHTRDPAADHNGDKVGNIGMTQASSTVANAQYLAMCPAFDINGALLKFAEPGTDLSNVLIKLPTVTQNLSTNGLKELEVNGTDLVADFNASIITDEIMPDSRCLRNAGARCFTDADCGPNKFIADLALSLDATSLSVTEAELKFWQEELVCGNPRPKTSQNFNLNDNKCCREVNKQFTIFTDEIADIAPVVDPLGIDILTGAGAAPGVDIPMNTVTRYTRMTTVYDELNDAVDPIPALKVVELGTVTNKVVFPAEHPDNQQNTIDLIGRRTCCSGNWVREFASTNGGGHQHGPGKLQQIDFSGFRCLNWDHCEFQDSTPGDGVCEDSNDHFTCTDPLNCDIRDIGIPEINNYLDWFGRLELTGVPQILLKTNCDADSNCQGQTLGFQDFERVTCRVDDNQRDISLSNIIPPLVSVPSTSGPTHIAGTLLSDADGQISPDAQENNSRRFIRADNTNAFDGLKQIFSKTEFSCCLPAGQALPAGTTNSECCTGQVNGGRCCLNDFADVSVYLNRYISSEASDQADGLFNAETGYLDPSVVESVAVQKALCCSGRTARGTAVAELKIPGSESEPDRTRRWVYNTNDSDNFNGHADAFQSGAKWNDHVYCVPTTFSIGTNP